ncbi:MAG TPA: capreomycidine synthase [Pyrinomonadaceae bacterium]|nr:capreomycidine synthase [Pyrinomonadaceae bacterium]
MIQEIYSPSHGTSSLREIAPALLERWMRDYYFNTEIDLGSSGVFSFSLQELQEICGPSAEEMASVVFDDSRTQGSPSLRLAIARRWGNGDGETVMATHGSSEAIHLTMNALLSPGDEVVVLDPVYQQLASIAEHLGCELKRWTLRPDRNFAPDLDSLKAVMTPRTRMVVVNFPHNPCGVSLTESEQKQLVDMVSQVGAYLVWDAAFSDLVHVGEPLVAPNNFYERAVTLGTLSKAYGLPGLRVGWLMGPPEVMRTCLHLRDYLTLHLSPLVELIAEHAITNADRLLALRLPQVRENLDALRNWAMEHEEWIQWVEPHGGTCAFPRLKTVEDVQAFCKELAEVHRVLLVPGSCFNIPDHVRLGFGGAPASFQEGLGRLTQLLKAKAHRR